MIYQLRNLVQLMKIIRHILLVLIVINLQSVYSQVLEPFDNVIEKCSCQNDIIINNQRIPSSTRTTNINEKDTITCFLWDESGQIWINDFKTVNTYDKNGNLVSTLRFWWQDNYWENFNREIY